MILSSAYPAQIMERRAKALLAGYPGRAGDPIRAGNGATASSPDGAMS